MKKLFIICIITVFVAFITSCSNETVEDKTTSGNVVQPDFDKAELDKKFGTDEIYIVKTILQSPEDDINKGLYIRKTHYLLSDGTWKTDEQNYKYKLILTGRLNNAANDLSIHVLSNLDDITFDDAWKALGFSSNSEDYFKPEDAVIVAYE